MKNDIPEVENKPILKLLELKIYIKIGYHIDFFYICCEVKSYKKGSSYV